MSDITVAQENAQKAIATLKESVLTVLAEISESSKFMSAKDIRDELGLKKMVAKTIGSSFGSTQIINAVLWLLENDDCVAKHGERHNSRWEITDKGLEQIAKIR